MKKRLTEEQVDEIIAALENGNYEASHDEVDSGHSISILVEDEYLSPVNVTAIYKLDDCKYGIEGNSTTHIIKVLDFEFKVEEEYRDYETYVSGWAMRSKDYGWPEDDELREKLKRELFKHRDYVDLEGISSPSSVDDEWSYEELIDEIESNLQFSQYAYIEDDYYGFDCELEEFLEDFYNGDLLDEEDRTEINVEEITSREDFEIIDPDEMAEILADSDIDLV